jgi:hypothetical protein
MATYPIPPWLDVQPAQFGEAAYKGATIRMERARLAQQAQEANQRAGIAAAELSAKMSAQQQAALREQQEAEIQNALEQAQLGLKTRQLDQAEQEINLAERDFGMKLDIATRKSAAQQEAAARIRAGEDPSKVWAELGPQAGITGSGLPALMKKPFSLQGAQDIPGLKDYKAVQTSPDQFRIIPPRTGTTDAIKSVPVLDDNGNPLPNVRGVPNASGGTTVIHLPQESTASMTSKLIE